VILDVNTYNFEDHDKVHSSNCSLHSCRVYNFILLE